MKKEAKTNPDIDAAEGLINIGREQAEIELKRATEHYQRSLMEQEFAIKIRGEESRAAQSHFFRTLFLRDAKERLKASGRWAEFCRENGIDLKNADYEIGKLGDLRDEFLLTTSKYLGFSLNKIKYLAAPDSENLGVEVRENALFLDGEEVPMEEIPELVNELKSRLKAKDRLLHDKQKSFDSTAKREAKIREELEKTKAALKDDRKRLYGDVVVNFAPEDQHAIEQLHYAHDQVWLALTAIASIDKEKTSVDAINIACQLCKHISVLGKERFTELIIARPEVGEADAFDYEWDEKVPFNLTDKVNEKANKK